MFLEGPSLKREITLLESQNKERVEERKLKVFKNEKSLSLLNFMAKTDRKQSNYFDHQDL